jgi:uncharacterized protein (DUF1501 family)
MNGAIAMSDELLYSRRILLKHGVGLLSAAATLPMFLEHSARCLAAQAAANPQGVGRPDNVLVVLQLAGGNDGLNTIIPVHDDNYYRARPKIGIVRKAALRLDDDFGVHPAAVGLKKLFDDGHLAVLHAVGYPNPNRSHFRATDIWATAEPEKAAHSGWLGRYFDACCCGDDPGAHATKVAPAAPDAAVSLTADPPTALQGEKFLPIAFRSPAALAYRPGARDAAVQQAFNTLNNADSLPMDDSGALQHQPPADPHDQTRAFLERTALDARVYAQQIRSAAATTQNKATYPANRLGTDLKLVAQLIASGLPTRVYYVSMGGFDTHSGQPNRQHQLMTELSSALAAFVDDLKALGQLDRTTVMTFSEFGRRVAENGSQGTDHGEAAPMLLAGGPIRPGLHGRFPDLSPSKLHRGDVPFTMDFRRVYATLLRQWLKGDDVRALGARFEMVGLLR